LGYYLVISHESVNNGEKIFVGREFEIDDLKEDMGNKWTDYIARVNEDAPLLVLDYSYLGLLADKESPVGGKLYLKGGKILDFHEPLSEWSTELQHLIAQ